MVTSRGRMRALVARCLWLCGLARAPQRERHTREPDLQIRLGVGVDAAYTSWAERDVASQSFRYEFVLPVAAIPADGLVLEVLDDDGPLGKELVGSMRLSRTK